jgi:hypothetical protein
VSKTRTTKRGDYESAKRFEYNWSMSAIALFRDHSLSGSSADSDAERCPKLDIEPLFGESGGFFVARWPEVHFCRQRAAIS